MIRPIKYLFLGVIALLSVQTQAQAQSTLDNYRTPIPAIGELPESEFTAKTQLYEQTPFDEKALAFEIRIPKDWEKRAGSDFMGESMNSNVIGELVRFYGPARGGQRSYLTVEAVNLEYQMSAEHWMLRYLLSNGLPVQGMDTLGRGRAEVLYMMVDRGETFAVRAVAQINGKRVLFMKYHLPVDVWKEERQLQSTVAKSFKVQEPMQEDVENMLPYHFLDVAKIDYPDSWDLQAPPIRSIDDMKIELFNYNQVDQKTQRSKNASLDGKIEVFLTYYFSVESLDEEIEEIKKQITAGNIILGEEIEPELVNLEDNALKANDDIEYYALKAFKATSAQNSRQEYEVWMTTIEAGDYYYFFTLLTPARDQDFFVWSRNAETYNLIVKSFEPNLDGLVYE